ncbi:hypothetical protein QA633_39665 [Bradyrhizobium barranii]|uniref:hypothetical protein n=1 Tax=Bradyrhizobium barranii TaxID=2992140 RepID=UPI0024AFE7EF|nr:hypothetical protein [Bradyrhizobium barranii]WFT94328.1 hypothetical protein QA633_39665 [Bradyrhizobium barranii]
MTMIEVILAELYRQSEADKGPGIYVDSSDHQRTMIDGWVDLVALVEAIDKHDTGACVPSLYGRCHIPSRRAAMSFSGTAST